MGGLTSPIQAAKKSYTPFQDPPEIRSQTGGDVWWRGDQMHPAALAGVPNQGPWVFSVRDLRWTFLAPKTPEGSWEAQFVDARIDTSKIKDLHLLWSPFWPEVVAGHTALYIEFEEGAVERTSESRAGAQGLSTFSNGLVLSVEARMKQGEKYSFTGGMKGDFPLVYSLSTFDNYKQRCLDVYQGSLKRWKLNVSPLEKHFIGRTAIEEALRPENRIKGYNLTRRSCATEFVDILIAGVERSETARKALREQGSIEGLEGRLEGEEVGEDPGRIRRVLRAVNPFRRAGISRSNFRRTTPHGILVNPYLSMPARLPFALERRNLIESADSPDELYEFQGRQDGEAEGPESPPVLPPGVQSVPDFGSLQE